MSEFEMMWKAFERIGMDMIVKNDNTKSILFDAGDSEVEFLFDGDGNLVYQSIWT